MANKVQKIREEVEKLKSQLLRGACSSQVAMETSCKEEAYNEVLGILDAMQEEPISEDLEEAASEYLKQNYDIDNIYEEDDLSIRNTFKAGANWQLNQIRKEK